MAEKITKQLIEELVAEEIDKLDEKALNKLLNEVGMFAGIGQAIKGIAGDVKGKFQQHRALPVAQKLAAKHSKNLLDVTNSFIGVQDNFNADYQKWSKNPFLKKILDGIEFPTAMDTAADAVHNVIVKLDAVTSGEVGGGAPAGADQAPTDQAKVAGDGAEAGADQTATDQTATDQTAEPSKPAGQAQKTQKTKSASRKGFEKEYGKLMQATIKNNPAARNDPKIRQQLQTQAMQNLAGKGKIKPTVGESLIKKIRAILGENKKVRIIKSNG